VVRWGSRGDRTLDGVAIIAQVESERVDWTVSRVRSGTVPTMGNGEEYSDSERLRGDG
jgi:hypothetical protein